MDETMTLPALLEESIPMEVFGAEVRAWAKRISVEPCAITFRPMKRKWASCSRKGNLSFDMALLRQPGAFPAQSNCATLEGAQSWANVPGAGEGVLGRN